MGLVIGNFSDNLLPDSVKDAIGVSVPKYGVKFNSTSYAGTRTYDAANLNWSPSNTTMKAVDDFENLAPFNVKECLTHYDSAAKSRKVDAYKGDANFDTLLATGNYDVMIEVPSFYYKRPSQYEFIISPQYQEGFLPSPMHYRKGVMKDAVRITKYNVGAGYVSQSGKSPVVNTNMNTFRTNFRNKGWYMLDYPTWCSMVMLMLVKYANTDIQSTVSAGRCAGNAVIASGNADEILGLDGYNGSISTTTNAAKTFGIENFFGNVWKYIDGLYGYGGHLYTRDVEDMTKDPSSTTDLTNDYTKVETALSTSGSDTVITNIAYDSTYPYMQFPTVTGTSGTTYSCDNYSYAGGLDCVVVSGNAWSGSSDGLFCVSVDVAVGIPDVSLGGLAIGY